MTKKEQEKMFFENEKIIWYVIWKYYRNYKNMYDELYQVGAVGLWKCILNFNESKGTLSTYAIPTIKYLIKSSLLNENNINSSNSGLVYELKCLIIKNKSEERNEIYKIAKTKFGNKLNYETFNAVYGNIVNKRNIEDLTYDENEGFVINLNSGFDLEKNVEDRIMLEYYINIVNKMTNKCAPSSVSIYIEWLTKNWDILLGGFVQFA